MQGDAAGAMLARERDDWQAQGTSEEGDEGNIPMGGAADLEADLAEVPDSNAEHFFVDADPSNPTIADEVIKLEDNPDGVDSITRFLTLPTVAARVNARHRDPIMDFSKSIMLTSEEYISAAAQVQEAKAAATRQKEIARQEKEERKKRKEIEREEERKAKEARAAELAEVRAQKQAKREEARAAREAKAAEVAHARAVKAAEREHAQRLKAEHAMQVADERARREAEKARRASVLLARATERLQGHQIPAKNQHIPSPPSTEPPFSEGFFEANTPHRAASPTVHSPHLPSTSSLHPTDFATQTQFPGFVTHVTSTMHPPLHPIQHHRIRPFRPLPQLTHSPPTTSERGHPFTAHVASVHDLTG